VPRREGRWAFLAAALFSCCVLSQERIQLCSACHGDDGNSTTSGVPSIAGQPKLFIETQLVLFREEIRKSEQMAPVMRGMKDPEIIKLAEHFSRLPAKSMASGPADAALMKQGMVRAKALRCGICHLADFRGQNQIPRLAGQREEYLAAELFAYRDGRRSGGDTIMTSTLYGVADADLKALAHFLARAKPPAR
jgi:cytochrome c553